MACSKYEYVKQFQEHREALPQTYMVVRVDGRGFTKFCDAHKFVKPNDIRAIKLMNKAAETVCSQFQEIFLAYGQSDEYSFAFNKSTKLFSRRIDKIQTCLVSCFTSAYVYHWSTFFGQTAMQVLPTFDARVVTYPNLAVLKDYFRWRQVDCHINNLYNTAFWCLMKTGMKNTEVENKLKDTNSGDKNELLFSQFGINYNTIEEVYRRGTIFCYKSKTKTNQKQMDPKISKYLYNSIQGIQQMNESTGRVLSRLEKSEKEEDQILLKQLHELLEGLKDIERKYEKISMGQTEGKEPTVEGEIAQHKKLSKPKKEKFGLKECWDDMIKDQFWEDIRLD